MRTDNAWYLKPDEIDFPINEPVLKLKRGLYYRPNNSGYTDNLIEAGLYERNEAISYCFDKEGKNGKWEVLAIPIRLAIKQKNYSHSKIKQQKAQLDILEKYTLDENVDTVIL